MPLNQAETASRSRASRPRGARGGRRQRRITPDHLREYGDLKSRYHVLQRSLFAACACLGVLCLALGVWALNQTHAERRATAESYHARARVAEVEKALGEAQREIAALVQGRIPHLEAVALDRIIPVGEHHVRNVAFTALQQAGLPRYEYRLVLQNESEIMTLPAVELVLFDRLGTEIARSRVGEETDASGKPLYPGESRSYSGSFDLPRGAEPAYFRTLVD